MHCQNMPHRCRQEWIYVPISTNLVLKSLERKLIPTGLFIELPAGYEAQIRPRSSLAIKKVITVANSPGTIDADYRGEICIILVNLSSEDFVINDGERICQMVIAAHAQAEWVEVNELNDTDRGTRGGFGHAKQANTTFGRQNSVSYRNHNGFSQDFLYL